MEWARLFPTQTTLLDDEVEQINLARVAMALGQPQSVIRAMPAADVWDLLGVMRADAEALADKVKK